MSALFASLPSTILDDPTRQTILDLAQAADAHANDEASYAIRQSLAHLIRGSSVKVSMLSGASADCRYIYPTGLCYKRMLSTSLRRAYKLALENLSRHL
jgi:hypothetical protein